MEVINFSSRSEFMVCCRKRTNKVQASTSQHPAACNRVLVTKELLMIV
jgi:hypothetical protein